jgi:hypothetical protein
VERLTPTRRRVVMRKWLLAAAFGLVALAVLVFALDAYLNRPGRFCHRNYERIQVGMALAEVEALLGGPGREIAQVDLPQSRDFSPPLPQEWSKPVLIGDQFFRWLTPEKYNGGEIIVGVKDGRVSDKWYWEYRLSVHWAHVSDC